MTARLRSLLDSMAPTPLTVEDRKVYLTVTTADGLDLLRCWEPEVAALIVELRNRAELMLDSIDAAEQEKP